MAWGWSGPWLPTERDAGADTRSIDQAFLEVLRRRTGRDDDAARAVAWLAARSLDRLGRDLVHRPPEVPVEPLLEAVRAMLEGLFRRM
jgi:hypothetical protein